MWSRLPPYNAAQNGARKLGRNWCVEIREHLHYERAWLSVETGSWVDETRQDNMQPF
jgi:hypothetical protein